MLIACSACHRQYDVGDLQPGKQVRCSCGELNAVPAKQPRQVAMLHCATCGGRLPEDGKQCMYCEAVVDPTVDMLGDTCPECFARMPRKSLFCGGCGTKIDPAAILKALPERPCPRCAQEALTIHEGEEESFYECTACAGIWLAKDTFQRFLEEQEADGSEPYQPPTPPPHSALVKKRSALREPSFECPSCSRVMRRLHFAGCSGVYFDQCTSHGYWFDKDELDEIREFVEQGGLEWARDRRRARARSKRRRGWARARQRHQQSFGLLEALAIGLIASSS